MRTFAKVKEDKLLFYDIETAPLVRELEIDTPLYDSWEYKANKTGEKTSEEVISSYSVESGLYPEFAKVVTIVVGKIVKGKIVLITFDDAEEVDILNKFNSLLDRNGDNTLVGFVNKSFDTPFTAKRMILNGIQPNDKLDSSGLKPWELEEIDLAETWKMTSFNRASLINIATAFGLPSPKDDISGADVGRVYWSEGLAGLKRIAKYCRQDVIATINIFRKMNLKDTLPVDPNFIDVEPTEEPLLEKLINGSRYGKAEKDMLIKELTGMTPDERSKAFDILDSVTSKAKGKVTKMTKTHVTALKKMFKDE